MYLRFILSLGLLWLYVSLQAQGTGFRYINFGLKDGLYDNYFYSSVQDDLGFMWIGSGSGLYKYNGNRFKKINSPLDKSNNSISSFLVMVNKDRAGNLWLGSTNSLQWMNPATNHFWQPKTTPETVAMMKSNITSSFFGKYTWLSTNKNYFYRFNPVDSSFTSFASKYPAGANPLTYRVFEFNDKVYALHPDGIYCFSTQGNFIKFAAFTNNEMSNAALVEKENCLLVTNYVSGLFKFDLTSLTYTQLFREDTTLKKNILLSIYKKQDGNILIGGYGLFFIDLKNNQITSDIPGKAKTDFDFSVNKVGHFFEDREHNIWVSSHFGLTMIPWQNNQIKKTTILDPSTKKSTEIIKIYKSPNEDEHFITTTSANGLLVYKKGVVTSITNKFSLGNSIKFLFYTKDGRIFATDYINFYELDFQKKTFTLIDLKDQNNKSIFSPKYFAEGANNVLYMGSRENGFYKWNYQNNKLTHYSLADVNKEATDNHILPMYANKKGNIWFVSNNGVYVYNPNTNAYKHLTQSNGNVKNVIGKSLNVTEDANNNIWVVTEGNGLFEFIEKTDGSYTINHESSITNKSLRTDGIWDIEKDTKQNILWLSTVEGLARFNPITKQFYGAFSMQNGMTDNGGGYNFEQSGNSIFQIFYSEVNEINKDSYALNYYAPKPIITSLNVFKKEYLQGFDTGAISITLKPQENYFEIEFAGLVFNNNNGNKYYYRLIGLDKEWQFADDKNKAVYSALPSGKYTFEVKYLNNDGIESNVQQVFITIKKPFYKTAFFIIAMLLTILWAAYAWYKYRTNVIKKETFLKQQIAEMEMKALRAQMNPHFIFNSLNSIQKYILQNEHFAASQYLTKFSRLIRLILDHSNQTAILLSSEIDLLKLYIEMESLRFDNKFSYAINVDAAINEDTIEIPSMLVQPYVENAIWHGLLHLPDNDNSVAKGILKIDFKKQGNQLLIVIEDNGVGRQQSAALKSKQVLKKKSYGMQITKNRIDIVNQTQNINATCVIDDLIDSEDNATGTRVTITLPIKTITN